MPQNEPEVTERKSVILSDAERRNLRRKLAGSVETAKDVLNPRTQMNRLVEKTKSDAKRIGGETARVARNNAPVIGVVGISALLFAVRRPLSNWISKLRTTKSKAPEGDEDRIET